MSSNKRKVNISKLLKILIWSVGILLTISLPFVINYAYMRGYFQNIKPNTSFTSGDILTLYGSILGGFLTFIGVFLTIKSEQKLKLIEKRALISIDEQYLIGYKLAKYRFPHNVVLCNNESLTFLKEHDRDVETKNGKEFILDHMEHRYLAIENMGEQTVLSMHIKFTSCYNDNNGRLLEHQFSYNINALSTHSSCLILYGGPLDTLKFISHYNLYPSDTDISVSVFIKHLEIEYYTEAGEKIIYRQDRPSSSVSSYSVYIESERHGKIFDSTMTENEVIYPNLYAIKSKELEALAHRYFKEKLIPQYMKKE